MRPCEVILRTHTTRQLCCCIDYVGDNSEPCQSCGHEFGRHGVLDEKDSIAKDPLDSRSLSKQPAQPAKPTGPDNTPTGSNKRSTGITSLLDHRLDQAGILHSKILSASNEANAGLHGNTAKRTISTRHPPKKGNNKLGSTNNSRQGGGDVEEIEIAGIFAYPIGLQWNERGMQQVPFSAARAGNQYLFQRCGLLSPSGETESGGGIKINKKWSYQQLNTFLKATFPWIAWLEADVGGDVNGFSPWALLSLDKKGSRSTLRVILEPYPSAESFLRYRTPAGKKTTVQYIHIAARRRIPAEILEQHCPTAFDTGAGGGTSFRILWDTLVENEDWKLEGSDEEDLSLSRTRKGKGRLGSKSRAATLKRKLPFGDDSSEPEDNSRKRGRIVSNYTSDGDITDFADDSVSSEDDTIQQSLSQISISDSPSKYINPWAKDRTFDDIILP